MKKQYIIRMILSILPFIGNFANAAINSSQTSERTPVATWIELREKLVSMRMPQAYYDFLSMNGFENLNELYSLEDTEIKNQMLRMYQEDLNIMFVSEKFRSIF